MTIRYLASALVLAAMAWLPSGSASGDTPAYAIAADHHMHIGSPAAERRHDLLCTRIKCVGISRGASTGADAVGALDQGGIQRGVLLSMAYMAASPVLGETQAQIASDIRAENEYTVAEAAASCGRLSAFISINPNSDNALDELGYWLRRGGAAGLKLHLGSSHFDFASPTQVERLAAVFKAAGDAHMPIIVHLRGGDPTYGAATIGIFLQRVLPAAHGDFVQIAHSGGWGGADETALSALGAFADAISRGSGGTENLAFDMAVMPDWSGGRASAEAVARYVQLMRQIGIGRFLLASDWVKGTDLRAYYASTRSRLNLTDAEWRTLAGNVAPYFRSSAGKGGKRPGCSRHEATGPSS